MPPSDTLAVLRDAFVVAMLALVVAAPLYAMVRRLTDSAWNAEGNVLTRPYGAPDAVVALLLLALFGVSFFLPDGAGVADRVAPDEITVSMLVAQSVFMLLLCLGVLVYLAVVRGFNPAEMFGLRQMSVKRAFLFAILGLVLTFLGMVLGTAALVEWNGGKLPDSSAQETVEAFEKSGSLAFRLMLGFMAVIIAPLTEELLFRGFLYGVIKSSTDRWFSAAFTALIFAIVHFHVGSAPQLFMLGLGLAVAYEQTGSLLVPVFMHAIFNGWNVAMLAYTVFTK
jgi:membrane protease YdiL (CAAX protease family)